MIGQLRQASLIFRLVFWTGILSGTNIFQFLLNGSYIARDYCVVPQKMSRIFRMVVSDI